MPERMPGRVLSPKVDESLYSRQLYVIGSEAMKRMLRSNVLVVGLRRVGLEVAKNLCLAGVRSVSILDKEPVRSEDLGTAFYCSDSDLGDRVDKSVEYKLKALNSQVSVSVLEEFPSDLSVFRVVVLCDQVLEEQLRVSALCREAEVPLVIARVKGLFLEVFCDFGESFITTDATGEEPFLGTIKSVSETGEVTLAVLERHNLEDGDEIEIKGAGAKRYTVRDAKAFKFSIQGYCGEDLVGKSFEQVKRQKVVSFKDLARALENPLIVSTQPTSELVHKCFHWADELASKVDPVQEFKARVSLTEQEEVLVEEFFRQCWESIAPITSVAGGIAAHEALKACSAKFMPLQQFLYYSALEMLPPQRYYAAERKAAGFNGSGVAGSEMVSDRRYLSLYNLVGADIDKIFKAGLFVVGAGAIGCEYLKNLALLGAGKDKRLVVTDMDAIEKSNLNRQFLFREGDISQMKSVVATREAAILNKDMNAAMLAYTSKVGKETETLFNDQFYAQVDVILNALDNVDARLYMDKTAIYQQIPMIDAGTLGTKGHTQTVIPYKTEHYGNTDDPQERSIPLCTIRNFPHLPVHCVEWALAEFKSLFSERILEAKSAISEAAVTELPLQVKRLLATRPKTPEDALVEAIKLFYKRFTKTPALLLETFPANHMTEEGTPFWIPPKKMPTPIDLSVEDPEHLLFINSAQAILSRTFNLPAKQFSPAEIAAHIDPAIREARLEKDDSVPEGEVDIRVSLQEEEFEKDSETNGHIDFISSAANIRCHVYSITPITALEAKKVAGRIIPAIATTTAVVSGLAILEGLKYLFWKDRPEAEDIYMNNYVSLAIPLLAHSEPAPPHKTLQKLPSKTITISQWDRVEIADSTLEEVLDRLNKEWNVQISTLMHDLTMLYCSFYNTAKFKANFQKKISEILYPGGIPAGVLSARVDPVIEDEEGNEVPVPFVKILFK
ncbi:ubiquitin-activating enzyme E1 [Nematocida homosporus]|uniref:ubiquitin-activating enzyme E1 n=1 Tax=Nematocida homosporus TaxID=1912981 RepID=UPI002220A0EE|nr:ubiquitin-activating enzyme E1 [Nematocida homosporus]KAI5185086.1 ubiquitin-activating enzyme E1 [Nematocida homosporus]